MTHATDKARKTAQKSEQSNSGTELDQRYGQIGISAVAAAVRYQGTAKNPAYAPVQMRWENWADAAA